MGWIENYLKRCEIEERCKAEAEWLLDNPKDSIRKMAREFGTSKSQIHRDLHALKDIDDELCVRCANILRKHKQRGG